MIEIQEPVELPDAPRPQIEVVALISSGDLDTLTDGRQSSSGSDLSAQQQDSTQQKQPQEMNQHDVAEKQLKEETSQRVVGVVPSFNVSYRPDAVALTAGQKFKLVFHTVTDPVTFATAFFTGGYHEIFDGDRVLAAGSTTVYIRENGTGFEWGPAGYFERVGAGYLDAFDGNLIGNAILPSILHQDPRFFRMGHGSKTRRFFYAAATSFICKGDKSRKWQPNYSNVIGNVIAGEISNLYYPSGDLTDIDTTISTAMIQTVEGSLGSVFQEFWPDISRKLFHKDPTHGIDAQYETDYAEAEAKKSQK